MSRAKIYAILCSYLKININNIFLIENIIMMKNLFVFLNRISRNSFIITLIRYS